MRWVLGISLCLILVLEGNGQQDTVGVDRTEFKVLPTAYYTPETRIAVGGLAYLKFYSKGADRPSNLRWYATVTLNRQLLLDLPWQIFTRKEKMRIDGKLDYRVFPEFFYGLGNRTQEADRMLYTYRSMWVSNNTQWNVVGKWFVGLAVSARRLDASLPVVEAHTYLGETALRGNEGYWMAGAGPSVIWDTRDYLLCPQHGAYLEATLTFHRGGDDQGRLMYSAAVVDARKYFSIDSATVLALQGYASTTTGQIPYLELPTLGGPLRHRGYYQGRFRDRHAVLTQVELRRHLFWRIGVAGFASVGRVYDDLNQPLLRHMHLAGGGGIRFRIGKHDNTNVRFDASFTPDSKGFYIYFAEAF